MQIPDIMSILTGMTLEQFIILMLVLFAVGLLAFIYLWWHKGVRSVVYHRKGNTMYRYSCEETSGGELVWTMGSEEVRIVKIHSPLMSRIGPIVHRNFGHEEGQGTTCELIGKDKVIIDEYQKDLYKKMIRTADSVRSVIEAITWNWKKGLIWFIAGAGIGFSIAFVLASAPAEPQSGQLLYDGLRMVLR